MLPNELTGLYDEWNEDDAMVLIPVSTGFLKLLSEWPF